MDNLPQLIEGPVSEGAVVGTLQVRGVERVWLSVEGGWKFRVDQHFTGFPEDSWWAMQIHCRMPDSPYFDTKKGGIFWLEIPTNVDKVRIVAVSQHSIAAPSIRYRKEYRAQKPEPVLPLPGGITADLGQFIISTGGGGSVQVGGFEGAISQIIRLIEDSMPAGGAGQALIRWVVPPPAGGITQALPGLPPFDGVPTGPTVGPQVEPAPQSGLSVSVSDSSATAGQAVGFSVTLSAPVNYTVTLPFATRDGTALAGTHYTGASGTLRFQPGETAKAVSVQTDPSGGGRSFTLEAYLGNAVSAGTGTILAPPEPTPTAG